MLFRFSLIKHKQLHIYDINLKYLIQGNFQGSTFLLRGKLFLLNHPLSTVPQKSRVYSLLKAWG